MVLCKSVWATLNVILSIQSIPQWLWYALDTSYPRKVFVKARCYWHLHAIHSIHHRLPLKESLYAFVLLQTQFCPFAVAEIKSGPLINASPEQWNWKHPNRSGRISIHPQWSEVIHYYNETRPKQWCISVPKTGEALTLRKKFKRKLSHICQTKYAPIFSRIAQLWIYRKLSW